MTTKILELDRREDGVFFEDGREVTFRHGHPDEETQGHARAIGLDLQSLSHARLLHCKVCRGYFLAHHTRRRCDDCAKAHQSEQVRANNQKRSVLSERWREKCDHCGLKIPDRKPKQQYCNNACKQAAYRERTT